MKIVVFMLSKVKINFPEVNNNVGKKGKAYPSMPRTNV